MTTSTYRNGPVNKGKNILAAMPSHDRLQRITATAALASLSSLPGVAEAYIGPGAGLGAIGTAIALLAAAVLLVVGFVWYPLKRVLRRRKSPDVAEPTVEVAEAAEEPDKP